MAFDATHSPAPALSVLAKLIERSVKAGSADTVAATLLDRFGGLGAVLAAPHAQLRAAGMSETGAAFLGAVHEAKVLTLGEAVIRRCAISSWSALLTYVKAALEHEGREQFRVLFLDKKNCLIADEVQNRGTVDHAPVYPREVMRRALELDASNIILVHNHPSGDPTPSHADIDMTRQIIEAGRALRIGVHDHLIVGREGVASLKSLGLM